MSTFSDRIRKLRAKSGLSQSELASRINIAKSTLAMYETGKREPNFDIVRRIADFFDVSVDYLLGQIDNPLPLKHQTDELKKNEVSILDLEKAIEMIEKGKAHFGGYNLTEEDRDFIAKMIRLVIERKRKGNENT
ncbi:helix-turn-helix domain-containing protein [Thermoactinomyces mirandus]|uniref:Helix-turn-helix domain-containing protein n=1 Tax=Thermoactinomyces mirandus TaxID=2756294 RepID=A0A7W2AQN1_9BACL|nr:helix-turn-helix domain-containing protein [Thermoactinomyces mirandus]MBA4602134.1 helix-turn-helix domain-containing protein [Thermoactinomyces mirandus]